MYFRTKVLPYVVASYLRRYLRRATSLRYDRLFLYIMGYTVVVVLLAHKWGCTSGSTSIRKYFESTFVLSYGSIYEGILLSPS